MKSQKYRCAYKNRNQNKESVNFRSLHLAYKKMGKKRRGIKKHEKHEREITSAVNSVSEPLPSANSKQQTPTDPIDSAVETLRSKMKSTNQVIKAAISCAQESECSNEKKVIVCEMRSRLREKVQEISARIMQEGISELMALLPLQNSKLTEEISAIERAHQQCRISLCQAGVFSEAEIQEQLQEIEEKAVQKKKLRDMIELLQKKAKMFIK